MHFLQKAHLTQLSLGTDSTSVLNMGAILNSEMTNEKYTSIRKNVALKRA